MQRWKRVRWDGAGRLIAVCLPWPFVCVCVCIQTSSWSVFIVHNALYSCWAMSVAYARLAQILEPTDPQLNLRQNFTKAFKCTAICIMSSVVTEALFVKWFRDRHKERWAMLGQSFGKKFHTYLFIYVYQSLNNCSNTQCDCVEKIIQLLDFKLVIFFKLTKLLVNRLHSYFKERGMS